MEALAKKVGERLKAARAKLVTAESCTGGWAAQVVTSVAGSSAWFERGFVTYSNAAKVESLGVDAALIECHGAVSAEVARAMAVGALAHSPADLAVAVTGIAGPGGGSPGKPVGTVWLALARRGAAEPSDERLQFDGDRAAVRGQTVARALAALLAASRAP
jgi:nicotinamide-nucleotide amidase